MGVYANVQPPKSVTMRRNAVSLCHTIGAHTNRGLPKDCHQAHAAAEAVVVAAAAVVVGIVATFPKKKEAPMHGTLSLSRTLFSFLGMLGLVLRQSLAVCCGRCLVTAATATGRGLQTSATLLSPEKATATSRLKRFYDKVCESTLKHPF